jgi:tripartite-type tricarboxylate transporter receptor subunit TctC
LLTDLVGGQLDATFSTLATALPYVRSGKLRPIGVTLGHRSPSAPDIPTIAEGGLPEFQVSSWFGVFAPAQTPAEILDKLNAEIGAGQRTPDVKERFAAVGADLEHMSREQFTRLVRDDTLRWARVVKESNLKL